MPPSVKQAEARVVRAAVRRYLIGWAEWSARQDHGYDEAEIAEDVAVAALLRARKGKR